MTKIAHRTIEKVEREQILKELLAYGYCIIEHFIESSTVELLKERVQVLWEQSACFKGVPERDKDDRIIYNLQNKDRLFIDLLSLDDLHAVLMPKLNDPFYRFLPPDVPNYYLQYYNARSSGQKLDLHIDSYIPFPGKRTILMQTAFLLDDHHERNGCTVAVPGSHLSGEFTDRELENVEPIIAKGGDLVLWDSRLWHGTLANETRESRWSLIATWGMWWIKPIMDITRGLSEEIYARLDERQKQLLGFCCMPPQDETQRINTKCGYDSLLPSVHDYFKD
jgi:hypothetical protein